jgi:nuclear pore complex protein Nup85
MFRESSASLKPLSCSSACSEVVLQVIGDMAPDPTDLEDMIHAALFSGQPAEALQHALILDSWLSAHLADIMESIQLIAADVDEE